MKLITVAEFLSGLLFKFVQRKCPWKGGLFGINATFAEKFMFIQLMALQPLSFAWMSNWVLSFNIQKRGNLVSVVNIELLFSLVAIR